MSLDRLLRVLRDEAEERKEEVLKRAREEAEGVVAAARSRAEERRARHRAEVEVEARDRARIRIAEARRGARERVLAARTEALEEVFRETEDLLSDAAGSDAYREALPGLLTTALAYVGGDDLRVRCSPGVEEVVEAALAESADGPSEGEGPAGSGRISAVEVDPSLPPGFRVTDSDGALTVDGTLEATLRRLRPRLSVELVGRVEGHEGLPTLPEVGGGPAAPAAPDAGDRGGGAVTFWDDLASRARGLGSHLLGADARREIVRAPDLAHLARTLAATPYGAHLATARPSPEGIEEALRRRAARDFAVLARWAGPSRVGLLSVVFEDLDRRSLRALVRGASAGAPSEARLRATLATPRLGEDRLREAARVPTPEVLAEHLERWGHPLAPAVRAGLGGAGPDLFRIEVELSRLWAARSIEAAPRRDAILREFVRDTVDEENLRTALARARSARGHGDPPFLVGGRWLRREAFGAAIGADGPGEVRGVLAGALADTPLESVVEALEDRTLEEAILDARIARTAEEARMRPGGAAPVLLFVLGLSREVRALRRLAWAVDLGAPVEERVGGGRAA